MWAAVEQNRICIMPESGIGGVGGMAYPLLPYCFLAKRVKIL